MNQETDFLNPALMHMCKNVLLTSLSLNIDAAI